MKDDIGTRMDEDKKSKALTKKSAGALKKEKSAKRKKAEMTLSPATMNAITAQAFIEPVAGAVELEDAVLVMREKAKNINDGDLSELEATLSAQIVSLNAIFTALAKRAESCEYMSQFEIHLRLALKAQAQSARTAEVLASVRNPPVVFAKQANIAQGYQQVNNGVTHGGKTINSPTELLEVQDGERMDAGTTGTAIKTDQDLETVGACTGTSNKRR